MGRTCLHIVWLPQWRHRDATKVTRAGLLKQPFSFYSVPCSNAEWLSMRQLVSACRSQSQLRFVQSHLGMQLPVKVHSRATVILCGSRFYSQNQMWGSVVQSAPCKIEKTECNRQLAEITAYMEGTLLRLHQQTLLTYTWPSSYNTY